MQQSCFHRSLIEFYIIYAKSAVIVFYSNSNHASIWIYFIIFMACFQRTHPERSFRWREGDTHSCCHTWKLNRPHINNTAAFRSHTATAAVEGVVHSFAPNKIFLSGLATLAGEPFSHTPASFLLFPHMTAPIGGQTLDTVLYIWLKAVKCSKVITASLCPASSHNALFGEVSRWHHCLPVFAAFTEGRITGACGYCGSCVCAHV